MTGNGTHCQFVNEVSFVYLKICIHFELIYLGFSVNWPIPVLKVLHVKMFGLVGGAVLALRGIPVLKYEDRTCYRHKIVNR